MQELKESGRPSLNLEALASRCDVRRRDFDAFEAHIYSMVESGALVKKGSRRVALAHSGDYAVGRFKARKNGDGVVHPDDGSGIEIYISRNSVGDAFLNDLVRVQVTATKPDRGNRSADYEKRGKIVRVLERGFVEIVGEFISVRGEDACKPDDPRFPEYIRITSRKDKLDPAPGYKVVVHLEDYGGNGDLPSGRLVTVLGPPDAKGVDIAGIIAQYSLPQRFPTSVTQEAKELPEVLRPSDYKGRKDCRKHKVITIDPDDARDFDDAIFVSHEKDGTYRVWVHIADVSHFVRKGSGLDREAEKRGNSTYLVDRVIPMLPEVLSNGLCSLQPDVDRLTKCAEIHLDPSGVVLGHELYPAVIHSHQRYTYQEAMEVIAETGSKNPKTDPIISLGWEIAEVCRKRRIQNGALDLDFPERKIRLNRHGDVESIESYSNDESHQLIEEFMLLANESVARELRERKTKSIFRIHEEPAKERLRELEELLGKNHIRVRGLDKSTNMVKAISRIKAHPAASALSVSVLRSMKRARYSTKPLGHFGLAKKDYTHFTSPIRRYADLIVHRSVFEKDEVDVNDLPQIADHISSTERNSADAEIDSKMVKLQKYLEGIKSDPVKGVFKAVVIDVRAKGLWVDIPAIGISGVVPTRALGTDSYRFIPNESIIVARKSGKKYKLGDTIIVKVLKIDKARRMFDFAALDSTASPRGERDQKDQRQSGNQRHRAGKRRRSASDPSKKSSSHSPARKNRNTKSARGEKPGTSTPDASESRSAKPAQKSRTSPRRKSSRPATSQQKKKSGAPSSSGSSAASTPSAGAGDKGKTRPRQRKPKTRKS